LDYLDIVVFQPESFQSGVILKTFDDVEPAVVQVQDRVQLWGHVQVVLSTNLLKKTKIKLFQNSKKELKT
jgi:hypothetical protein